MNGKKKFLAMAVLCAVASVGFVLPASAEETMQHDLDEVIVEADRDALPGGFINSQGSVGFLGKQSIIDAPFALVTINEKAIKTFSSPHNGIIDALSFDPSVRPDCGGTYTDFSIRGIYASGHNIYVNGIPGMLCQENIPFYWVDSASIISGPNLGVSGSTLNEAVGGTVNFQSKVATKQGNSNFKVGYRGGSSMEEAVDIGRRFGKDDRFGIRVTANNIHGETTISGENLKQQNLFINLDQQSKNSKTNLLLGYNHTDHQGGPGSFTFDNKTVTSMPSAPDSSKLYKPDWSYNEYDNWVAALNHEQKLSNHLSAFINAGYHREDWYGYIDGNPKIINNNGDFTISMTNYPLALTKKYIGIGLKGDFKIGSVKNDYVIGVDKNWMNYDLGNNPNWSWNNHTGNIYQNNFWPNPGIAHYDAPHSQDTQLAGWHIIDTMKALDDKLQVTLGLHGHEAKKTPANAETQKSDAISPTFAISYKFSPDVMVYANHTESFGMGAMVATNKNYANAGDVLDPSKTKQNEVGIKIKTGKFLNTFSAFQIRQANNVDVYEGGKKYLRTDGEQENKGFEWGFTGNVANKWDLVGGAMYLNAKDNKGDAVNGAAKWSGTLGAIYHPNQDLSLIGRVTYLGSATINSGTLDVPAYAKFDLGASYKTKINSTPVTIDAMCYNITGKDYWNARSGSSSLSLGAPRTFVLSATFDI